MARLLLSAVAAAAAAAAAAAEESHLACLPSCMGSTVCWNGVCMPSQTPLPVLPIDSPPAVDDSVSVGISHKHRLVQSFIITAASLLAFSFSLLLVFYFLLRLRRRRHLADLHQHQPPPPLDPNAADDDLLDDDGGPHHVWYIRTVGLDDSVIRSIAATIYKAGDGLIDGGDCSVCLGEFSEGETIKLLPKCAHAFHLSCIDTWLRSHVNCPLCRAPVVAPPSAAAGPAEAGGSVPSPESAQIEISQRESREECVIAIDSAAAASSSSSSGKPGGDVDGEVQPIRRSVSMDSSSLGMLLLRAESESDAAEEKLGEEKREIEVEAVVGARKNKGKGVVECLGKQQPGAEIKRSLSSRSGRLFFPRYGRGRGRGRAHGRSASVLPL